LKPIYILAIALLLLLPASALAQGRRRTTGKRATQSAKAATTDNVRLGAERVAEKVKLLTRFLYLLGRVTSGFENIDELARSNRATPAELEKTQKSKADVKATIRNVREGLDELEIYFRTTPELQRYYTKLAGVAAGAAAAEEQAASNQFDQAGRSLLGVVNRLTDVMLEMR
jgi:hypothetical protein